MTNEINLEQLKKLELELMTEVHKICERENYRYSLGGGTLLGAVRHNGFIPWDDDIDIMMPRPDYDKFIAYCLSHETPFKVRSWETDKSFVDFSAKLYNDNTILEDDNVVGGSGIGVNIDVFPIDGLGKTYKEAKKAFNSTRFKRNLLIAAQWKKYFRSKTHAWYYEPFRFAFFILSRFVNKARIFKKILKKYKKYDFDKSDYVAAVGGAYREKEILPHSLYEEFIELPFEGEKFKAIAGYKEYLTSIYGDYMQLPPEEKRVSHHTFTAFYKGEQE